MQKVYLFAPLLLFQVYAHALCEVCEYEMEHGAIYSLARDGLELASMKGLQSPYMHISIDWPRRHLEYCTDYSIYREKFNHLIWSSKEDLNEITRYFQREMKKLQVKIAYESSLEQPDWEKVARYEALLQQKKSSLSSHRQKFPEIQQILINTLQRIGEKSSQLYTDCIDKHEDRSFYERSLTYFDQGKPTECVNDISKLLETEGTLSKVDISSELYLAQGVAYSDLALYNKAITALTEAIKIDPQNKDAYLERAAAYFEIGNFEQAIEDFLASDFKSTPISSSFFDFGTGFIWGASNGFIEAVDHFVPSILSSMKGLGNAVWTAAISPERFSMEVVNACTECVNFLAHHSIPEILEVLSPNLKELVFEFDTLTNSRRGELFGQLLGKEGVEIFATTGALKAYREIRKANLIATLETLASPQAEAKVLELAQKWEAKHADIILKFKKDEAYIKSLKQYNFSESTIRKTLHEMGYQTFPRPKQLPANFIAKFTDKGAGMKYVHPENSHTYVRVMPGKPHSPFPHQQTPYVNQRVNGQSLNKYGQIVPNESIQAHITLEDFIYRKFTND